DTTLFYLCYIALHDALPILSDTQATDSPLSGNVLFYNQPEPLNVERHGKLGVNQAEKPYAFVGSTNLVPLTVTEFAPAALSFPVDRKSTRLNSSHVKISYAV